MAKVDEIAQGFVQLRLDCAGLEDPPALQAPLPVIGFPTEYPHRRLHQKPCCCQANQHLPRVVSEDKSMRFSLPTAHLPTLHGHGNGFQEDLLHPSLPTAFSWQQGVAVLFIPGTNPLQGEFVLPKLILRK